MFVKTFVIEVLSLQGIVSLFLQLRICKGDALQIYLLESFIETLAAAGVNVVVPFAR